MKKKTLRAKSSVTQETKLTKFRDWFHDICYEMSIYDFIRISLFLVVIINIAAYLIYIYFF